MDNDRPSEKPNEGESASDTEQRIRHALTSFGKRKASSTAGSMHTGIEPVN